MLGNVGSGRGTFVKKCLKSMGLKPEYHSGLGRSGLNAHIRKWIVKNFDSYFPNYTDTPVIKSLKRKPWHERPPNTGGHSGSSIFIEAVSPIKKLREKLDLFHADISELETELCKEIIKELTISIGKPTPAKVASGCLTHNVPSNPVFSAYHWIFNLLIQYYGVESRIIIDCEYRNNLRIYGYTVNECIAIILDVVEKIMPGFHQHTISYIAEVRNSCFTRLHYELSMACPAINARVTYDIDNLTDFQALKLTGRNMIVYIVRDNQEPHPELRKLLAYLFNLGAASEAGASLPGSVRGGVRMIRISNNGGLARYKKTIKKCLSELWNPYKLNTTTVPIADTVGGTDMGTNQVDITQAAD